MIRMDTFDMNSQDRFGLMAAIILAVVLHAQALMAEERALPVINMTLSENADLDVAGYMWTSRLVIVFADSSNDPRFLEQMENLQMDQVELLERDVVVLIDTDPSAGSAIRMKFRPRGFVILLVGKDGAVALRKPVPWNVREIRNAIDKLPVRQQEMKAG